MVQRNKTHREAIRRKPIPCRQYVLRTSDAVVYHEFISTAWHVSRGPRTCSKC